ncbi:MAG: DUF1801 domain-containing protein [Draconibacterium sp.]
MKDNIATFEEYIQPFPVKVQNILKKVREVVFEKAPDAEESISYGMPAYKLYGKRLVYFAGYKNHIGFYATPTGHEEFKKELSGYKQGKGSVQFPLNLPIPYNLIGQIVEFRVHENREKMKEK